MPFMQISTPAYSSSSQAIYPQCIDGSSGQQNWAVPLEVRLQMVVKVLRDSGRL
jgi:hypothetical protein